MNTSDGRIRHYFVKVLKNGKTERISKDVYEKAKRTKGGMPDSVHIRSADELTEYNGKKVVIDDTELIGILRISSGRIQVEYKYITIDIKKFPIDLMVWD